MSIRNTIIECPVDFENCVKNRFYIYKEMEGSFMTLTSSLTLLS